MVNQNAVTRGFRFGFVNGFSRNERFASMFQNYVSRKQRLVLERKVRAKSMQKLQAECGLASSLQKSVGTP